MTKEFKNMLSEMKRQSEEFTAAEELAQQLRRVMLTPVVDDDYPEVRFGYEQALARFIQAMKVNQRFMPGNRYGLGPK
jgi:hypothetical protein